jgi:acyl carrier protein
VSEPLEFASLTAKVAEFLGVDQETLTRQTHLYDDLGLDSLGMFSLGMYLIKSFAIRLPLSEVANISTIGDIHAALERHRVPAS